MRAHEAGWAHAAVVGPRTGVAARAGRPQRAGPRAVVAHARARSTASLEVGGSHGSPTWWPSTAPRRTSWTRRTSAPGRAPSATRSRTCDVYYAGKAFLCTTVARWIAEEGLSLDVCTGGELARGRAGRVPDRTAIGFHGNNKSTRRAGPSRRARASAGSSSTRSTRSSGWPSDRRRRARRTAAGHGPGDRRGRGAHPRVHRHRARGPEVRLLDQQRRRAGGGPRRSASADGLELLGLHSHIGSQIFDSSGFEVAARRVLALHAADLASELGVELPELDLGGGFGIAYTTQDDPSDAAQLAIEMTKIVRDECEARGLAVPRLSVEPGRAIAGPAMCTVYEVGTVKAVELDGGAVRTYVSVDGGMSDNIRTALYDADYSCTLANRAVRRAGAADPAGRQALRGRRHRRQGRVPARRRHARRPGRGPRHRRLLPVDGQQLQPPAAASGGGGPGRRVAGRRAPRDRGRPARHDLG